jgi:hypothetical protein
MCITLYMGNTFYMSIPFYMGITLYIGSTLYMDNTSYMGTTLYSIQGISFTDVISIKIVYIVYFIYLFICFNKTSVNGPLLAINACVSILLVYSELQSFIYKYICFRTFFIFDGLILSICLLGLDSMYYLLNKCV